MSPEPAAVRAYGLRTGWREVEYLSAAARGEKYLDGVPVFKVPDREAALEDAIRRIIVGSHR